MIFLSLSQSWNNHSLVKTKGKELAGIRRLNWLVFMLKTTSSSQESKMLQQYSWTVDSRFVITTMSPVARPTLLLFSNTVNWHSFAGCGWNNKLAVNSQIWMTVVQPVLTDNVPSMLFFFFFCSFCFPFMPRCFR